MLVLVLVVLVAVMAAASGAIVVNERRQLAERRRRREVRDRVLADLKCPTCSHVGLVFPVTTGERMHPAWWWAPA